MGYTIFRHTQMISVTPSPFATHLISPAGFRRSIAASEGVWHDADHSFSEQTWRPWAGLQR